MRKYGLVVLLTFAVAIPAFADNKLTTKPGAAALSTTTVTATVESIDYKTRHVTLKGENGKLQTLKVGEVAHNFDQVKKGDKVTFQYMEAIAIDVQKATGNLETEADVTLERAAKGERPGGVISGTVTLKASVEDIDYDKRYVTLTGPQFDTVKLKVGDHVKRLNEVKKGDQVVVKYTEALGISVTTPKG